MITVRFKSKEAFEAYCDLGFYVNLTFGEYFNWDTPFKIKSFKKSVRICDVKTVDDKPLVDACSKFTEVSGHSILFAKVSEMDLLEEVYFHPEANSTAPFNSTIESVRINFVGDYNKTQLIELKDKLTRLIEEF